MDASSLTIRRTRKVWMTRGYVNKRKGDCEAAISDISQAIRFSAPEPDNFFTRRKNIYFKRIDTRRPSRTSREPLSSVIITALITIELTDFGRADAYIRLKQYEKAQFDLEKIPEDHRSFGPTNLERGKIF